MGKYHSFRKEMFEASQHVFRSQNMVLWFAFTTVGLRMSFVAGANIKKLILCHLKQTLKQTCPGSHLVF